MQTVETNITQTDNSLNQPGQPVTITATLENNDPTDETVQLALFRDIDTNQDEQLNVSKFGTAGEQTRTVSSTVTPTQTETFSIQGPVSTQSVTIDIAELNLVDVSLVTQEPVTTDETVIIDATVSNTGATTGFIPLTLRQNEVVLNLTSPTEVPVGKTVTQRLTGTLDEGTQNPTVTSGLTAQSATVGELVVTPPGAITNATVRVAGASAPSVFNDSVTETIVGPNNQTVEIRATDIKTVVDADETNISLGTVTVTVNESVNVSQTIFTVSISRISDDTGTPINVTTQNGTVNVNVSNQGPLADGLNSPTDLDGNSVFEDVSGNERLDFNDIVVLFENLRDAEAPFQDLNENGRIEFDDIVELLRRSEYIIKAGYHAT